MSEFHNLVWSCARCNSLKRRYDPGRLKKPTFFIIRRDQHDPDEHFSFSEANEIKPSTETGFYNILTMDLNREALKTVRRIRAKRSRAKQYVLNGYRGLMGLHLDQYPPEVRNQIIRAKKQAEHRVGLLSLLTGKIIQRAGRSDIISPDHGREERQKALSRYLNDQGLFVP